ncbi:MAG: DUF5683 domain-containing protein [Dysgonamonadaceae bacterium]|jgi:hypothetical protein|nr:DUF5683 domain-containing protein [Dysgonamonadaceae bacterium]
MGIKAQEVQIIEIDSVRNANTMHNSMVDTMAFKPNSTRAILYSALFPGLGQIYNRKYWKLPFVYGCFIGCAYAINWNNSQYTGYKAAFMGFEDADETTDSWKAYVPRSYPENLNEWSGEQRNRFSSALKSKKDYYRNYRDMSIIITIGVYAVWIIDAYVDAQLFDFDVSTDLSMRVAPVLLEKTAANPRSLGLQLSFTF